MKKGIKFYAIIWAISLVLFNIICFASPNEAAGLSKFGGSFWVGYIFITIAFIGQLICSYIALKTENLQKLFYNLPLISLSYTGLILTIVFGSLCMAIPNLPNWIGAIICMLILAFTVIAVIRAGAAAEIVSNTDEKIKAQTSFIKSVTVEAESLLSKAKTEEIKSECKKVYEAVKYSDPVSNPKLANIENKINFKISELSRAVDLNDGAKVKHISEEIILLVKDRSNSCKIYK